MNDFQANLRRNRSKSVLFVFLTFFILGILIEAIISATIVFRTGETYDLAAFLTSLPIAFGVAIIIIFVLYLQSSNITLKLANAKVASQQDYLMLNNIITEVSVAAGIKAPKIYVIEDLAPNAFACGTAENGNIVFTRGILQIMNREELQGVAAHEMSHLKNGDSRLMTIIAGVGMAIGFLTFIGSRMMFFSNRRNSSNNNNVATIIVLIVWILSLLLAPILALLTQAAVSRKREWMADDSAVSLTRNPAGLESALEKLQTAVTEPASASKNIAHLWIADPVSGDISKTNDGHISYRPSKKHTSMFDTHPPLEERIKHLKAMQ
ncbi:MAG: M48 family metalloprotease [Bifidobacteriaceae bacterium]|jgi:heat shock protein HtpX|nr:M48 family metalloprotease [Bifidobacteriaceae bacterium]